jgi:hypothetical protein
MAKVLLASVVAGASAEVTVMVFGDSYGDTGPKWNTIQDMFDQHGVAATVKNAAIGGTTACQWAGEENGMQLVNKAKDLFGESGPTHVWYTLGGNDIWADSTFQDCQKSVKGKAVSDPAVQKCISDFNTRVIKCHSTMFDNFYKVFPNTRILQAGYDVPCGNLLCGLSVNNAFAGNLCGTNDTCLNTMLHSWNTNHLDRMQQKYPAPGYTAIKLIGAVQMANNVAGADYDKPVLDKSANCAWETECIHPTYNTPAGKAWGDGMWKFYFSKQGLNASSPVVV